MLDLELYPTEREKQLHNAIRLNQAYVCRYHYKLEDGSYFSAVATSENSAHDVLTVEHPKNTFAVYLGSFLEPLTK